MLHDWIIKINNWLAGLRKKPIQPEETLLLVPHCLQNKSCNQDVTGSIKNCVRCGKCRMGELAKLQDEKSFELVVANGGRQACEAVRQRKIRAVIAVACEKELSAGILATRPKRVIAIPNQRPHGPCRNTDVKVESVQEALERVWSNGKGPEKD